MPPGILWKPSGVDISLIGRAWITIDMLPIPRLMTVTGTRNLIKLLGISKVRFATVADGDLVCSVVFRSSLRVESNTEGGVLMRNLLV